MDYNYIEPPNARSLNNAFIYAVENNNLTSVETLLEQGADINFKNGEALLFSIKNFKNDLLTLLVDFGANLDIPQLNSTVSQPFFQACYVGNLFAIDYLIKKGIHLRHDSSKIIDYAIRGGKLDCLLLLINSGIEPIGSFQDIFNPLKKCIIYNQKELFDYFLPLYKTEELSTFLFQLNSNSQGSHIKKTSPFIEKLSFYIQSKTLHDHLTTSLIEQNSSLDKKIKI